MERMNPIDMAAINVARVSADAKHGILTSDPIRATLILVEEVGEVAAEALKMTNPTGAGSHRGAKGTMRAMYDELAQVGATVSLMMENIRRAETARINLGGYVD